jgi:alkylation response protein AidB-like acyl-CoA dehydrogenase
MDFDFSEDQQALRDAVRKWVDRSYTFERRSAIAKAGGFDRGAYGELAELGLAGLYVAEEHGGMGMGPVEAMVVMEEMGRGIVVEPLKHTLVATGTLGAYGSETVKSQWLPKMATGEALVVLAHQERKARYRIEVCETQAVQSGTNWHVTGTKSVVPAGDQADAFIVPAMAGGKNGTACQRGQGILRNEKRPRRRAFVSDGRVTRTPRRCPAFFRTLRPGGAGYPRRSSPAA